MTDFNLPDDMTAKRLREMAVARRLSLNDRLDLRAWADAIDPPKPEPVVTDEMVEDILPQMPLDYTSSWEHLAAVTRAALELAVERDWTPPAELKRREDQWDASAAAYQSEALRWKAEAGKLVIDNRYWQERFEGCDEELTQAAADKAGLIARLTMAEDLLRLALPAWRASVRDLGPLSGRTPTPDEAEYLRSLDGEGE